MLGSSNVLLEGHLVARWDVLRLKLLTYLLTAHKVRVLNLEAEDCVVRLIEEKGAG